MNFDDDYQAWLDARRGESPPADLSDRIMAAVRESNSVSSTSERSEPAWETALQRTLPFLVCSAAALVLAVRLYSFVSVFVVAPSEIEFAMTEPVKELSDVSKP